MSVGKFPPLDMVGMLIFSKAHALYSLYSRQWLFLRTLLLRMRGLDRWKKGKAVMRCKPRRTIGFTKNKWPQAGIRVRRRYHPLECTSRWRKRAQEKPNRVSTNKFKLPAKESRNEAVTTITSIYLQGRSWVKVCECITCWRTEFFVGMDFETHLRTFEYVVHNRSIPTTMNGVVCASATILYVCSERVFSRFVC